MLNKDGYPLLKEAFKNKIDQPVLFIGGGEEAAVKYGDLQAMNNALSNLRDTIDLKGSGHYLQQERTGDVNTAIINFLNKEIK